MWHTYRIPCLNIHCTRSGKLADQAFGRRDAGNDAARGDTLKDVFRVPRNQMAIVHSVLFPLQQLFKLVREKQASRVTVQETMGGYVRPF